MPSISANTLITLPARQLLIFSGGGTGVAQVSGITGGPVSYVVGLYESYVGPYDRETSVYVTGSVWPITYTIDTDGVLPTLNDLAVRLTAVEASGGGGGVADDAVTNAKLANVATATIKGRATAGTGDPEDLTASQVRTLLNVANGATANSADATLLDRANHTGAQTASTISDFNSATRAQVEAELIAGTNVTITPGGTGATRTLTIAAAGSGGVADGDKGDITVSGSGAAWTIDAAVVTDAKISNRTALSVFGRSANSAGVGADMAAGTDGHVLRRSGTTLGFGTLAAGAFAANTIANSVLSNVATATFKGRATAGTGVPEDMTATQATALLNTFTTSLKGLAPASGGGTTNFLRADGTWAAPAGGGTVTSVGMTVPTGLSVSGSPVTGSGTLAVTLTAGYVIPTQAALDAKLDADLASEITTAKTSFSNTDKGILLDAAASDAPKTFTGAVMRTTPVGSSLGTTGTVNLDFSALVGTLQTISATGNITFTASNYAAGLEFELRIDANGGTRTIAYPATWKAYGAALPTSLASGKVLTLAIRSTGTTEGAVDATSALSV